MILTLHVNCGFSDNLQECLLRVQSIDRAVILDAVEVDVIGVGAAFYDRLREMNLRAPVVSTARLSSYSAGLLKK